MISPWNFLHYCAEATLLFGVIEQEHWQLCTGIFVFYTVVEFMFACYRAGKMDVLYELLETPEEERLTKVGEICQRLGFTEQELVLFFRRLQHEPMIVWDEEKGDEEGKQQGAKMQGAKGQAPKEQSCEEKLES